MDRHTNAQERVWSTAGRPEGVPSRDGNGTKKAPQATFSSELGAAFPSAPASYASRRPVSPTDGRPQMDVPDAVAPNDPAPTP